jgi:DNA primase
MAFSPEFLDELRARTDLGGLIGRRVRLTKHGREFSGLCPFHNEKTPSFTVSPAKGFYHCFGCGAHGDAVGFVMQSEGLSFVEAVAKLAGEAGLALPQRTPEAEATAKRGERLREALEATAQWFTEQLQGPAGREARAYLEERGLSAETVAAFRLGFAPDRRGALRQAMHPKGFDDDVLAEAGLIKRPEDGGQPRDYLFNRIVFPITDRRGRVIAFGGRALGDSKAKYLNSPETPLFHKGRHLYNLATARQAAHDTGELLVAEGYMDVIALVQGGFPAAVAPLGTAVTEAQIQELWRLAAEPILCLDGDAAGRKAASRAAERALALLRPGRSLRFALLPGGEDPDSLLRGRGAGALRDTLTAALPLAEMLWLAETEGRSFETPERRAGLRQELRTRVREIQDSDVRQAYEAEMERRLAAAFGQGGERRRPYRQDQSRAPGGRPRQRIFEPGGPGVRQSPEQLWRRSDEVLLATLLNHPELLVDHTEEVSALRLESRDLDQLRRAMIDLAAREPGLDSVAMRCHLSDQGVAAVLSGLLSNRVYTLGPSARPDTPLADAREDFRDILARQQARVVEG